MYKRILAVIALFAMLLPTHAADADYQVIPLPQQIIMGKSKPFNLLPTTQVICASTDELMTKNAQFLCDYIKETTGLTLQVNNNAKVSSPVILLTIDPKIQGEEAYRLTVTPKRVTISGKTSAGVFYGIQTLRKSLPIVTEATSEPVMLPSVEIVDARASHIVG